MQASSPSSFESNETSFYTAADSHLGSKSTTASSPVQETLSPYEDSRQLPRELKLHCHIFLDEGIYSSGIGILNSVLAARTSRRLFPSSRAVPVPPSTHLALLLTLLVHPSTTTRVRSQDYASVPFHALDYLRSLLTVVGPINADFKTAVKFNILFRSRSRQHPRGDCGSADEDSDSGVVEVKEDQLMNSAANAGSVWKLSPDFWTVVGWVMNCSALHPRRWKHWRPWLEFMIELMEADWDERARMDEEEQERAISETAEDDEYCLTYRQDSIIAMYMDQQTGRRGTFKTFLKAIFADGESISTSLFKEVFLNELRGPKKNKQPEKRKRDKLDLENGHFADYIDDEDVASSGGSQPPTPEKPRPQRTEAFGATQTGLAESMDLRVRLFKLVSMATWILRKPEELAQLYEDAAAALKVLPLPMFSHIMSQRESALILETQVTFTRKLLLLLVPSCHKSPSRVDPETDASGSVSMAILEKCFVIHAANSIDVVDNAKLSLVIEKAIQLLWLMDELEYTECFAQAVETGVQARSSKVKKKRGGKNKVDDPCDSLAEEVLENSSQRIRLLMSAMSGK